MSLHVLHAGSGYRYLLRSTAAGDGANPADGLAAYYAATGTPPGVWVGTRSGSLGTPNRRWRGWRPAAPRGRR